MRLKVDSLKFCKCKAGMNKVNCKTFFFSLVFVSRTRAHLWKLVKVKFYAEISKYLCTQRDANV